jgi:hypothetical protein
VFVAQQHLPIVLLAVFAAATICVAKMTLILEEDFFEEEIFTHSSMSNTEHSATIFLLDALDSAPNKAMDLLGMALRPNASKKYKFVISELTNSLSISTQHLINKSKELRQLML